jgi:hypothetical protein
MAATCHRRVPAHAAIFFFEKSHCTEPLLKSVRQGNPQNALLVCTGNGEKIISKCLVGFNGKGTPPLSGPDYIGCAH